jgi:signal recognition particle subunit SRP54
MFDLLQKRLSTALKTLRGKTRIGEPEIDAILSEVRTGFLEADVHFRVTRDFLARVKERCLRQEIIGSLSPEQQIVKVLSDELTTLFGGKMRDLDLGAAPPVVILMCGLQGSGKTTSTAKLGSFLAKQGRRVGVVSVDVQRPAAMQQLKTLAEAAQLAVMTSSPSEKPVEIAKRAKREAYDQNLQVLIVDTAGRLQVDQELMGELKSLGEELKPQETLLVIDAMMGQQAVEVAESFETAAHISGAILSKLDGDARGGAALSLVAVTGKPIKFVGTGERSTDFEVFHPDRMASRLLDMGDLLSLLEKAEQVISEDEAKLASEKIGKGDFSLEDFRSQMKLVSRMGSISSIFKMMPGLGQFKEQLDQVDTEKEMKRIEAMMSSMTPQERRQPDAIDGSRRKRIAAGSGVPVSELNSFLKRFFDARKMMKQLGKMSGLMKGLGGGGNPFGGGAQNPLSGRKAGKGFGRKF